jgi:hypothetical protein
MLHDSLRALTEDASLLLEDVLAAGAEIPFEVGQTPTEPSPGMRGSVTMFAYRPLTAEFVATHADRLRGLAGFENAAQNLARTRGVIAYLRVRNEPVLDVGELTHARLGVLAFLTAVWQDAERFEHWGERFERAYGELESVALAERLVTSVFIPVHGVALAAGTLNLGGGAELIAAQELDPECADCFSDSAAGADSYCSISVTAPSDAPTPMPEVRQSARVLLTALRLFRPGSVALGMTAQADICGSWHQVSMPFSGRAREAAWPLSIGDEEELRQFVAAVRRIERRTRVAWAMKRFETGLERTVPADGLTDFLLALRALLESEDDRGRAALPARVAALCAHENERETVRAEIEAAFALERLAINGSVGRADRKRLAKFVPLAVIAACERHLRALLHDLVCGYLSTDLKALADEILGTDGAAAEMAFEPEDPVYLEPVPDPGAEPVTDPTETVEFDVVFDDTAEIRAIDMREDVEAFHGGDSLSAEGEAENVWTLRPATEIAPPPPVSPEPPPLESAMEPLQVPAWEASPERRPAGGRDASSEVRGASGFTFDFQLPTIAEPPQAPAIPSTDSSPVSFPIPEFGLPLERGPAIRRSDEQVGADRQSADLSEIMDEQRPHPLRAPEESVTTPPVSIERSHLSPVAARPQPTAPRIVPPTQLERPLIPLDPQATIEYDVLGAEASAEETAQMAWSEQFLQREEAEPALQPPRPLPDLVVAKFPEPVEAVDAQEHGDNAERGFRIGPATVEFRPVVDADPDDPDDFCGGA